ncbi:alpha/beta fold hydrolase [Patescibacteria group bacterium]|nr:alpha/beta fold hydrolase [Patescibacteria group bacterium]
MKKERITFNTTDGIIIVGNFFAGPSPDISTVLLLHMMPAVKESWGEFAEKLVEAGFQALAIDLRGHGESTSASDGRQLNFNRFGDKEHQDSILDVEMAREWLKKRGVSGKNIFIGGASIGANLALQYLAEHPEVQAAFLLSPGLDYHGIKTNLLMEKLTEKQQVFLSAAKDDAYSAQTVSSLNEIGKSLKVLKLYDSGGHGTNMFATHPELMEEIINWLNR